MPLSSASKFGLKEVCDVKFYEVSDTQGSSTKYSFDSLKVSNVEIASEEAIAKGGQGNPDLISWSYGKTVTLTMEDALLSLETLGLMFGGEVDSTTGTKVTITDDMFPGTYRIVGTTYLRSFDDGKDYAFTMEIPKGKVNASGTLTMSAEGDPSTFEMTVKALRTDAGELITFTRSTTARA